LPLLGYEFSYLSVITCALDILQNSCLSGRLLISFQYSENVTIFPREANRYHTLIKSTIFTRFKTILFHRIHHLTSVIVTIKKPVHKHLLRRWFIVCKITFVMNETKIYCLLTTKSNQLLLNRSRQIEEYMHWGKWTKIRIWCVWYDVM
jgi:hypothetical protein